MLRRFLRFKVTMYNFFLKVPIFKLVSAFILLCLLSACGRVPVAQDVNQTQANKIVATLNSHGIGAEASRRVGGKALYAVEVKHYNYARAIAILNKRNLPGKPKATFDELIAKRGLIPDSRAVEALRIDHALAVQIEELLEQHPAILEAKVVLRRSFDKTDNQPALSAVITKRPAMEIAKPEALAIILKAVPGLSQEQSAVSINEAVPEQKVLEDEGVYYKNDNLIRVALVPFLFAWHVPEGDYTALVSIFISFMVLFGVIGAIIGYWYGYLNSSRSNFESGLGELKPKSLKLDEERGQLPEV